jgi:NADPH-dependent 2,4-dienoyl-CoA reductase/sulfur reductase-like enzyme
VLTHYKDERPPDDVAVLQPIERLSEITNMAVDMENRPLKVTIIGAGIAGLTAALALRKQGHVVTVG